MTSRVLALVAFKTLALWLFASGFTSLVSGLLTWAPDSVRYGFQVAAFQLAAASMFVPVGALLWIISEPLSARIFPGTDHLPVAPARADLYAFAFVLVGLFLLTDAITQGVYWAVVWRSARGTSFWNAARDMSDGTTVVYWVSARAQVGAVAVKLVVGGLFLAGPQRLSAALLRLRKEMSGTLEQDEASVLDTAPPRDGV